MGYKADKLSLIKTNAMNTRRIEFDDPVDYLFLSELSYLDNEEEDVELYVRGKSVGLIKVHIDTNGREYIHLTHNKIFLSSIKTVTL